MGEAETLAGREAVDACRTDHTQLYSGGWYQGISEDHTPLLQTLVSALEGLGFTSDEIEFELKKIEILAKFWAASDLLNVQQLGFDDWADFLATATSDDWEAFRAKWK